MEAFGIIFGLVCVAAFGAYAYHKYQEQKNRKQSTGGGSKGKNPNEL